MPLTPQQAQAIAKEAEEQFPSLKSYDYVINETRRGYITAATKYQQVIDEKDKEIDRLKEGLQRIVLSKRVYGEHPLQKIAHETLHNLQPGK